MNNRLGDFSTMSVFNLHRLLLAGVIASCALNVLAQDLDHDRSADAIYTNARVYTVDGKQPWAEAFAVRDGRFIAVGSAEDMNGLSGNDTKIVDMDSKMILPGLFDSHMHPRGWYTAEVLSGDVLMLPGDANPAALAELIRSFAEDKPDLEYIFGANLPDEQFGEEPTSTFLDAIISDRPAYMITATGHEALLNTPAMKLTGIDKDTPDPRNGIIVRNPATGEATGFLKEAAMGYYAMRWLKELSVDEHVQGLSDNLPFIASMGITSIKWMHAEPNEVEALYQFDKSKGLPIRVAAAWTYDAPTRAYQSVEDQLAAIKSFKSFMTDRLDPTYVKVNIDGIPSETAAMLEPYVDDDGTNYGLNFYDAESLAKEIVRFEEMGLRGMVFHTVGDRGARIVLDAMALAKERLGELNGRYQNAHAMFISKEDMPRNAELGLVTEFSPILWFPDPFNVLMNSVLGPERISRLFPMRSVIDSGGRIVLASDGPLYMQTPLASIESAVTRRRPEGGEQHDSAAEAITLEEAIAARTINSAYLSFDEDELGSIEVGKLADFVVIDRNLFAIPIDEVSDAQILTTVVEGKVVFDRQEAVEELEVLRMEITNADLQNAVDAAKLDLLVKEMVGEREAFLSACCEAHEHTIVPGSRNAPEKVNVAFGRLLNGGYRSARPAREIHSEKTGSTYWIQWTIKHDAAVLFAYDPKGSKAVQILQVQQN